ncbi:MAG: hypothetical protein ABFR75_05780 [Acidobacteriota bacterium]
MKFLFFLIIFQLIFHFSLNGVVIEGVEKPYGLYAGKEKLYIFDGSTFSYKIYSLKSLKQTGKFGRKGEGPGEFRGSHEVSITDNDIVLSGAFTLFKFSKDGVLIDQIKTPPYVYLQPVGDLYAGHKIEYDQKELKSFNEVYIYDNRIKTTKNIYKQFKSKMKRENKNIKQDIQMIDPLFKVDTYKNSIYIADCRKGFCIEVFDKNGDGKYSIKKNISRVKVTQGFKDKMMARYKRSKLWIENKRNFNYIFPKFFYDIKTFKVADDKIYVVTFQKKNKLSKLLILDLKGNFIKKMFIPFSSRLYDFKNDKYYYMEDTGEDWELHILNLIFE